MFENLFSSDEGKVSALIIGFLLLLVTFITLALISTLTPHKCSSAVFESVKSAMSWMVAAIFGNHATAKVFDSSSIKDKIKDVVDKM